MNLEPSGMQRDMTSTIVASDLRGTITSYYQNNNDILYYYYYYYY